MSLQESVGGRGKRRKLRDGVLNKTLQDNTRALYHCNYCQKDISHVPRIKCAECKDFDLCLECFSVGVEIKPHKNSHDYQVVENLSFPILHPDWGADEEVLLLEAIDQYGLGNWAAVAEHVGGKTASQCRQHYLRVYIEVDTRPLPKPTPEMEQVDMAECIARARQGYARSQYRPGSVSSAGGPLPLPAPGTTAAAAASGAAAGLSTDPRVTGEGGPARASTPSFGGADVTMEDADRPLENGDTAVAAAAAGADPSLTGALVAAAGGHADHPGAAPGKGLKRHRHEEELAEQQQTGGAAGGEGSTHIKTGGRSMHHEPPGGPAGTPPTGGKAPRGVAVDEPSGSGKPGGGSYDATGFHPKRLEFDPEYDNDAECIVADMEFNEHDSPADVQQKLQMLLLYNRRLDERERRRSFVLDRGLLNMRASQVLERRRNTQEKDLHARMRVFARFQSQAAHDELVEGLLLEARMRTRIAELREYRRNGVRTFVDAEVYDTEKRRQKAAAEAAVAAANAVHGHAYSTGGGGGRGGGRGAAARAAAAVAAAAAAGGGASGMFGVSGYGAVGEDGMALVMPTPGAVAAAASSSTVSSSAFEQARPAASVYMGRGAGASLALWRAKRGVPLDVTCLPGLELLTARERELCAAQRLLPAHYLALKDMLMRDCEKNGSISKAEARTFFRLDPARSLRIYDLLVSCCWVRSSGPHKGLGAAGGAGGGPAGSASSRVRAITAEGETEGEEVDDQGDD